MGYTMTIKYSNDITNTVICFDLNGLSFPSSARWWCDPVRCSHGGSNSGANKSCHVLNPALQQKQAHVNTHTQAKQPRSPEKMNSKHSSHRRTITNLKKVFLPISRKKKINLLGFWGGCFFLFRGRERVHVGPGGGGGGWKELKS